MTRTRSRIRAWAHVGGVPAALLIFIVAALAGMVLLSFVDVQGGNPKFDGDFYRRMAEHPRTFIEAPFSYRVFTPMLLWLLPIATRTGFAVTTVLGVAGTAAILFLYVRTFDDRAAALRAVVFFGLTGGVLFVFVDPWLVDPPTMLLSMLTFLLVRRGHIG
jgi:hypothetical protein